MRSRRRRHRRADCFRRGVRGGPGLSCQGRGGMNVTAASPTFAADHLTPVQRIKAVAAGSAGNLIEWYDFYVYAFTSLYLSAALLPDGDRTAQLLNVAGIYAAGFLIRPIGGWFFGRFS